MDALAPAGPHLIVTPPLTGLASALTEAGLAIGRPVVLLIGGAAKLEAGVDLARIIRDGVIAVADSVGAVVLDGGTDAGVMALAGQAHKQLGTRMPLVGVAPVERLRVDGVADAHGTTSLEPNHTHAVLAPGKEWGDELAWLIESARVIADAGPVVAVLVDGGPLALSEAMRSLAQGWPLITLAGTGRAADDVAALARGGSGEAKSAYAGSIQISDAETGAEGLAQLLKAALERQEPPAAPQIGKIEFPALYVAASGASRSGQKAFKRVSRLELGLTLIALAFAVLTGIAVAIGPGFLTKPAAGQPDYLEALVATLSAATFLAALLVRFVGHQARYDDDWFIGRAVSESVKSMSWRYMTRVSPYSEDDGDQRFRADLAGLLEQASGLRQAVDRLPSRPQQISPTMRAVRALRRVDRRDVYLDRRLRDQADWYVRRSGEHGHTSERWYWRGVILQLLAVSAAIAVVVLAVVPHATSDWLTAGLRLMSLAASGAIAVTAWSQLTRDAELSKSYGATFQELLLIIGEGERSKTQDELTDLVRKGEEAIGRENRVWLVKRAERFESPEFGHPE